MGGAVGITYSMQYASKRLCYTDEKKSKLDAIEVQCPMHSVYVHACQASVCKKCILSGHLNKGKKWGERNPCLSSVCYKSYLS
jgi:hypothetical protein